MNDVICFADGETSEQVFAKFLVGREFTFLQNSELDVVEGEDVLDELLCEAKIESVSTHSVFVSDDNFADKSSTCVLNKGK